MEADGSCTPPCLLNQFQACHHYSMRVTQNGSKSKFYLKYCRPTCIFHPLPAPHTSSPIQVIMQIHISNFISTHAPHIRKVIDPVKLRRQVRWPYKSNAFNSFHMSPHAQCVHSKPRVWSTTGPALHTVPRPYPCHAASLLQSFARILPRSGRPNKAKHGNKWPELVKRNSNNQETRLARHTFPKHEASTLLGCIGGICMLVWFEYMSPFDQGQKCIPRLPWKPEENQRR